MPKPRRRNFHLPLPDDLYASLRHEAAAAGRPATDLAREAIQGLIRARRRRALDAAVAAYASESAGSPEDLDMEMEAAAIEHLLSDEGRR